MKTENILIISSSVRRGRNSHRVAIWFQKYLTRNGFPASEIADLKEYDFPLFEERLVNQDKPSVRTIEFAGRIKNASGIIIVTPEYNGSFPASLKNVIDLLTEEWVNKPVAFATVSQGILGGSRVITSLQFILWKMGAATVSNVFIVPNVEKAFDAEGNPSDENGSEKKTKKFIQDLLKVIDSKKSEEM
ncbi:MAG TPA: NAD(P)H-dependent oxidoreductase [Bacteroidales bacterium]|nr:NAD(P)H-dependent oxidoreductase [Bacteroidales bacterium]